MRAHCFKVTQSQALRSLTSWYLTALLGAMLLVLVNCASPQTRQVAKSIEMNANVAPVFFDNESLQATREPAGNLRCNMVFAGADDGPKIKATSRLVMDLQDLQDRLSVRGVDNLVKQLTSSNVRVKFLHLQALSKVYARRELNKNDLRNLEAFRQDVKEIEKVIGDHMRVRDLYDLVAETPGVNPEILARLNFRKKESKSVVEQKLVELGWAPDPFSKISQMINQVSALELGRAKEDQESTARGLRELVDEERDALKEIRSYFEPAHFSQDDLENGVHTMRRALRWVGMVLPATEGMFTAVGAVGMDSANLQAYGDSKYLRSGSDMPATVGKAPIPIKRETILKIVMLIEKLGELKDFKESELDYAEFLVRDGFAVNIDEATRASHQLMIQAFKGDRDVENEARELYNYYLREDPLRSLRKQLDRAI